MIKSVNIKNEILKSVKNAKFEGASNFKSGNSWNSDTIDIEISFDLAGKHISFVKNLETGWNVADSDSDGDACFEECMLEKMGLCEEDIKQMTYEERKEIYERIYEENDYDEWAGATYILDILDSLLGGDDEDDFVNKLIAEYIEENIFDFYEAKDTGTGFSFNLATYMYELYILGEFVGYFEEAEDIYFAKNDMYLFEKKYVKIGKLINEEDEEWIIDEGYGAYYDLCLSEEGPSLIFDNLYESEVKIEENGDIMMADYFAIKNA